MFFFSACYIYWFGLIWLSCAIKLLFLRTDRELLGFFPVPTCASCHLGLRANMLPIWSECQATVLIVMVVAMVVYTEHISNHLENHVSEEFSEPHFMPEKRTVSDFESVFDFRVKAEQIKDYLSWDTSSKSIYS